MAPEVAVRFHLLERRLGFMERRLTYYEAQLDVLDPPPPEEGVEAALARLAAMEKLALELEAEAPPDEPDPPGIRFLGWSPLHCRGGDPVRLHLDATGLSERRTASLTITEIGRPRAIEEREVTLGELKHRALVWNPPVLGARARAYVFTVRVAGLEAQSAALLVRD
jgi:hypothetical protein